MATEEERTKTLVASTEQGALRLALTHIEHLLVARLQAEFVAKKSLPKMKNRAFLMEGCSKSHFQLTATR